MRDNGKAILLIALSICIVTLSCCKLNVGGYYPVTPINNEPVRNVDDVDVPPYTLSFVDGHVVADVDYVINIDMTGKDSFKILNFADVQLGESDVRRNNNEYRFFVETAGRLVSAFSPFKRWFTRL